VIVVLLVPPIDALVWSLAGASLVTAIMAARPCVVPPQARAADQPGQARSWPGNS
jgi:hypothetical protein